LNSRFDLAHEEDLPRLLPSIRLGHASRDSYQRYTDGFRRPNRDQDRAGHATDRV